MWEARMTGLVLAFSGGLGSGKSLITHELSKRLGWPRVSFGPLLKNEWVGLKFWPAPVH
jgi:adenylate kinase family enzyme